MENNELQEWQQEQYWEQQQREQDAADFNYWLDNVGYEEVLGG